MLDFNFELWMGQRRGWNLALAYKLGLQRSSGSSEMRQRGLGDGNGRFRLGFSVELGSFWSATINLFWSLGIFRLSNEFGLPNSDVGDRKERLGRLEGLGLASGSFSNRRRFFLSCFILC